MQRRLVQAIQKYKEQYEANTTMFGKEVHFP